MILKILTLALAIGLILAPLPVSEHIASSKTTEKIVEKIVYVEIPAPPDPTLLTHAQEIWISALEWCESQGFPEAVNHFDTDGTASYYSYQFKPGTFRGFGEKYELIDKGLSSDALMELMKDTEIQRSIVRRMIKDTEVNLRTQFPGCIRKLGMPPAY